MRVLYFIRDPYPTNRPDVLVLFGRCLSARGIGSDLVGTRHGELADQALDWPGGEAFIHEPGGSSVRRQLGSLLNDCRRIRHAGRHDALLVRDKILTAAIALLWPHGRPVVYWASYPFPEEDLARAATQTRGWLFRRLLELRGRLSGMLLYRLVIPRAALVFAQSDRMAEMFTSRSGRREPIVAVPMGVDAGTLPPAGQGAATYREGEPFRLVYLGSMDRIRRVEFLLELLAELRRREPDIDYRLRLIGSASTPAEMQWLRDQVHALGLQPWVEMTGALPREQAWALTRECHLGLSAIPRGPVYDVSSPTKTIEYLALGLPMVVNDIPDQALVIEQTGAGLCVPMALEPFAGAVIALRTGHRGYREKAAQARGWLLDHRAYERLADQVASALKATIPTGR